MKYLLISCHSLDAASCPPRNSVMKSNYLSNRRRPDYSGEVLHVRLVGVGMRLSTLCSRAWRLRVAGLMR